MKNLKGFPNLKAPEWDKNSLSHFALNTTVRCQHRCVYCFEGTREGKKVVSSEETKKLIDQAAAEVPAVIFMGAEPTLNPALPELIRYARSRGLQVRLSTNALRLANWDYLLSLHEAGLGAIEMSFPHPDETVYARITGAKPDGFFRILQAIENIARLDRSSPPDRRHGVNVVVPVSSYNVERLDEILAHLVARMGGDSFGIKLKCLDIWPFLGEKKTRDLYAPCSALRKSLLPFAAKIPAGVDLALDGFPLCAIPGLEPLGIDLGYWMNDVVFRHNFIKQERMEENLFHLGLDRPAPFDWICEQCCLAPICISRDLFRHALPDQPPEPIRGGVPEPLREWVSAQTKSDAVWDAPRIRTALGWVLGELLKLAPCERPLAGTKIRWSPSGRGVILLKKGRQKALVRLPAEGRFFPLVPCEGSLVPEWAKPGVAALDAMLRCLPAPRMGDQGTAVSSALPNKAR